MQKAREKKQEREAEREGGKKWTKAKQSSHESWNVGRKGEKEIAPVGESWRVGALKKSGGVKVKNFTVPRERRWWYRFRGQAKEVGKRAAGSLRPYVWVMQCRASRRRKSLRDWLAGQQAGSLHPPPLRRPSSTEVCPTPEDCGTCNLRAAHRPNQRDARSPSRGENTPLDFFFLRVFFHCSPFARLLNRSATPADHPSFPLSSAYLLAAWIRRVSARPSITGSRSLIFETRRNKVNVVCEVYYGRYR